MTDSVAVFDPGWRATDSTGAIVSGAKLKFFDAGTTTPKLVYSNSALTTSLGSTVTCNSAGYPTSDGTNPCTVFTGTAAYKIIIYESDGTTQVPGASWDNLKGALDTSTFLVEGAASTLSIPVTTKSANYTITADDNGKLFKGNVSGGGITLTLPSASVVGNGFVVGVQYPTISSTNVLSVGTTSAQTIEDAGLSSTTSTLTDPGETKWYVSDGTGWTVSFEAPSSIIPLKWRGFMPLNSQITASVSGNALTVALKDASTGNDATATTPVYLPFRSATATSGAITWRTVTSALSITAPTSATLGTANNTAFRLWVVAFDTGSAVVLGLVNCFTTTGIFNLSPDAVASGTAISSGSTSAGVIYSASAQTSRPICILGYIDYGSGLATAGTWSTGPSLVVNASAGMKLPGDVVDISVNQTGAVSTGTTAVPFDDTIPQITEGDQYMTLAHVPASAANLLRIEAFGNFSPSASTGVALALFQDSTANALAATANSITTGNYALLVLAHSMRAGTNSSTTFRLRAGVQVAATITFNGVSGGRLFNGVAASSIRITEIMG